MIDTVFTGLNDNQIEAVKHLNSSLLVLAGAGSGKTAIITRKITHLVKNNNYDLDRILAITFTNKAANEMKSRVVNFLSLNSDPRWITTFHSMCAKILRIDADRLGYKKNFLIYDEKDSEKAVKSSIIDLKLFIKTYDIGDLKRIFSHAKQYANNKSVAAYEMVYPMIT
jgi:DNA helicase II / ATP-dependent DNA helicase PcrA